MLMAILIILTASAALSALTMFVLFVWAEFLLRKICQRIVTRSITTRKGITSIMTAN